MKDVSVRNLLLAAVVFSLGCGGVAITTNPDPVPVTGKVVLGGKPGSDVKIKFQATGIGLPAVAEVKNGEFSANVVPGTYTYYFSEGSKPAVFNTIPEAYRSGSLERQTEIKAGSTLEVSM